MLPLPGIQPAETLVAVRLERAHAQLFGQGERLTIVANGRLALWGRLARRALTQELQGPGLVAALLILAGEIIRLLCTLAFLFRATGQQIRLAERGDHTYQRPRCTPGGGLLRCLFRQR